MLNPTNGTLDIDFQAFHAANPDVYDMLVKLAKQAKAQGKRKIGIKMLFEVVRWEKFLHTSGIDFKLNNNYTSRYARLIMQREPVLQGLFNLRGLQS